MDSYGIHNGVPLAEFDMIALAIAFYESICNICLIVTKVQQAIIINIHVNNMKDVIFIFPLGDTAVLDCSIGKKCNFIHNGYITETSAKSGQKLKKKRK